MAKKRFYNPPPKVFSPVKPGESLEAKLIARGFKIENRGNLTNEVGGLRVKAKNEVKEALIDPDLAAVEPETIREETGQAVEAALVEEEGTRQPRITLIDEVYVPPDEGEAIVPKGLKGEIKEKKTHPRLDLACEVLTDLGVVLGDESISEGKNRDNMMRRESYRLIRAPELDRMVLLCDEEGNRSFVIYENKDPQHYRRMRKSELMALKGDRVEDLLWCGPAEWQVRLRLLLLNDPSKTEAPARGLADAEYYSNFQWVRKDLETLASTRGLALAEINTGLAKERFRTARGDEMSFNQYLEKAAVALGMAPTVVAARKMMKEILDKLKEIAGVQSLDEEYFRTPENIQYDFDEFAKQLPAGSVAQDVTTSNIANLEITASNGERVKGQRYLITAGLKLGKAKQAETLLELQKTGNLVFLDKAYFEDPVRIKKDLTEFMKAVGCSSINELTTLNIASIEITCTNGQRKKGATYLSNAVLAEGWTNNNLEMASFRYKALTLLKKRLELPMLDADYFKNSDNIAADLNAFCILSGGGSIETLSTYKMEKLRITTKNGLVVSREIYLDAAGVALGFAEKPSSSRSHYREILTRLKEIAAQAKMG